MNEWIKWVSNSKNFSEFGIGMAKAQEKKNQKQNTYILKSEVTNKV